MHTFFAFLSCAGAYGAAILGNGYAKNKCGNKSKQTIGLSKTGNQHKHLNQTKCSNQNAHQLC